jgi:general secretion pathway protein C
MEFRLSQRHIIAVNFLLIAGIAYFAARSANQIVALFVATPPAAPPAISDRYRSAGGAHPRNYYDTIVKRDIFNLVPQTAAIQHVDTAVDLHLRLLGTSLATRQKPYAIIENQSGEQSLYRLGQDIPGAGRLIKVEKNRVIVQHGAHQIALEIPETAMPAALPVRAGMIRPRFPIPPGLKIPAGRMPILANTGDGDKKDSDVPDVDVEDEGGNHYSVNRNDVKKALQHQQQLLNEIKATPYVQNGVPAGFTLSDIEPGSVFDDLGLQEGDRLTAVNGTELRSVGQAYALMGALQSQNTINVTVIRDGVPVQLQYSLH